MKKLIAVWGDDYDGHADKIYRRPVCPECKEPFGIHDPDHRCFNCGRKITVTDPEMLKWLDERSESKVVMEDDPVFTTKDGKVLGGCGGKKCVETHYRINPATKKWEVAWGQCTKCGMRFIV